MKKIILTHSSGPGNGDGDGEGDGTTLHSSVKSPLAVLYASTMKKTVWIEP